MFPEASVYTMITITRIDNIQAKPSLVVDGLNVPQIRFILTDRRVRISYL
jgi:hypothetical protein